MALVLRFRFYHHFGRARVMRLGRFIPSMTPNQRDTRDAIYKFLLETEKDHPDMAEFAVLYHNFADSLLRTTLPASEKLAGPTDWALFLETLLADNTFNPDVNPVVQYCSQCQYDFRSIRLHIGRLQLNKLEQYCHPPGFHPVAEVHEEATGATVDNDTPMPLLGQITDDQDDLREANEYAWDMTWDEWGGTDDADAAANEVHEYRPPVEYNYAEIAETAIDEEPVLLVDGDRIDLQDVEDEGDLLRYASYLRHRLILMLFTESYVLHPSGRYPFQEIIPYIRRHITG